MSVYSAAIAADDNNTLDNIKTMGPVDGTFNAPEIVVDGKGGEVVDLGIHMEGEISLEAVSAHLVNKK